MYDIMHMLQYYLNKFYIIKILFVFFTKEYELTYIPNFLELITTVIEYIGSLIFSIKCQYSGILL